MLIFLLKISLLEISIYAMFEYLNIAGLIYKFDINQHNIKIINN